MPEDAPRSLQGLRPQLAKAVPPPLLALRSIQPSCLPKTDERAYSRRVSLHSFNMTAMDKWGTPRGWRRSRSSPAADFTGPVLVCIESDFSK